MNNKNLIRKLEVLTFENNRLSKEIEQNRLLRQSYLHIHRTIENYEEDLMELIDNLIGYNPYRRKEITKVRIRLQRIFNVMLYYYKSEALQGETKKDLHRLKRLFPSLSKMELEISALILLGLTSEEIGDFVGKSRRSIENYRYRIRLKLEVDREIRLVEFLRSKLK